MIKACKVCVFWDALLLSLTGKLGEKIVSGKETQQEGVEDRGPGSETATEGSSKDTVRSRRDAQASLSPNPSFQLSLPQASVPGVSPETLYLACLGHLTSSVPVGPIRLLHAVQLA